MTEDGRDDIEDLLQEIGDALQYAMKAKLNGRNLSYARDIANVLVLLLNDEPPKPPPIQMVRRRKRWVLRHNSVGENTKVKVEKKK